MDCKKIGNLLYELRQEKNMTQKNVADLMNISDKTISKWERGLGCPDVSLLPELAQIFDVNIENILFGKIELNELVGGNMKNIKFYVCPNCGNLLTATGDSVLSCCGKKLEPLAPVKSDEKHQLKVEPMEDELFISTDHEMRKEHYLSFVAFVTGDKILIVKQYPEWNLQCRIPKIGHGKLYHYCTNHGMFFQII